MSEEPFSDKLLKTHLINAVDQNNVDELSKHLINSREYYEIRNAEGFTLLQLAIIKGRREVFDYLLSLPDFPLETKDFCEDRNEGTTALEYALSKDYVIDEHFACELIQKGANIDLTFWEGDNPLNYALKRDFMRTATVLIQRGADVNCLGVAGRTPMEATLIFSNNVEFVLRLLDWGAIPTLRLFILAALWSQSLHLQQILYPLLFDGTLKYTVSVYTLLELAKIDCYNFRDLLEHVHAEVDDCADLWEYFLLLASIKVENLKLLLAKVSSKLQRQFRTEVGQSSLMSIRLLPGVSDMYLDNLAIIFESELKHEMVCVLSKNDTKSLYDSRLEMGNLEELTQLICFLTSYGLNVEERFLQWIFQYFGYCDMFRILMHADFTVSGNVRFQKDAMALLFYDFTMSLQQYFNNLGLYETKSVLHLLDYFYHPKLIEIYERLIEEKPSLKKEQVPEMSLLQELARNKLRTYLIESFHITSFKQFYQILNQLPLASVHKKILTFEKKLY